jgi:hypothetical protein
MDIKTSIARWFPKWDRVLVVGVENGFAFDISTNKDVQKTSFVYDSSP